jgi:hypothetical protein
MDEQVSRSIETGALAGVTELARLFLVGRSTVTQWAARRERNGFPLPVSVLAMGPIYDVNEVLTWYGNYVPDKGGRPGRYPGAGQLATLRSDQSTVERSL